LELGFLWSGPGLIIGPVFWSGPAAVRSTVPTALGPSWRDDLEFCQNLHRIVHLCVKLVSNMWNIVLYQCQGSVWPRGMPIDAANVWDFDLLLHCFAFSTDKCLTPVPNGPGPGPDRRNTNWNPSLEFKHCSKYSSYPILFCLKINSVCIYYVTGYVFFCSPYPNC
jgi:hypothetical protein